MKYGDSVFSFPDSSAMDKGGGDGRHFENNHLVICLNVMLREDREEGSNCLNQKRDT